MEVGISELRSRRSRHWSDADAGSYRTAKVWKDFQLAYTIEGHEQSVWAVLALDGEDDLVLTGACSVRRNGSNSRNDANRLCRRC